MHAYYRHRHASCRDRAGLSWVCQGLFSVYIGLLWVCIGLFWACVWICQVCTVNKSRGRRMSGHMDGSCRIVDSVTCRRTQHWFLEHFASHTAIHPNKLQHPATHCQHWSLFERRSRVRCSVAGCVVAYFPLFCSVYCPAKGFSSSLGGWVCCSIRYSVCCSVCCSALQCVLHRKRALFEPRALSWIHKSNSHTHVTNTQIASSHIWIPVSPHAQPSKDVNKKSELNMYFRTWEVPKPPLGPRWAGAWLDNSIISVSRIPFSNVFVTCIHET